jgi:hypothetical protein
MSSDVSGTGFSEKSFESDPDGAEPLGCTTRTAAREFFRQSRLVQRCVQTLWGFESDPKGYRAQFY